MPQEMGMYSNLGRAMAGDGQSRSLSAPMIPTTAAPRPMNMGGGMPGGAPGGMLRAVLQCPPVALRWAVLAVAVAPCRLKSFR